MTALRAHVNAGQLVLTGVLLCLALAGWLGTGELAAGMDTGPWAELGGPLIYAVMWVVMMAAMMFPSAVPAVLVYARVEERRREARRPGASGGSTALFVAGYLVTWAGFGLVAYALVELLRGMPFELLAWDRAGRELAAAALLAAAAYQLTPFKDACLGRCRNPLDLVVGAWREGRTGAIRMGVEHGAWCVGCCWALMAALFALGVMDLRWMAFVAALVALEKMLPWKAPANVGIAAVLFVVALAVALEPALVPGLR